MKLNRVTRAALCGVAATGIAFSAAGPAMAAPTVTDSASYVTTAKTQSTLWKGVETWGNMMQGGVNVLFGGSYGGGGNPFGSDEGTWWYALHQSIRGGVDKGCTRSHPARDGDLCYPKEGGEGIPAKR